MLKDYIGKRIKPDYADIQEQFCKQTGLGYGGWGFYLTQEMSRKMVSGEAYVLDLHVEWNDYRDNAITSIYLQTDYDGGSFKAKSDIDVFTETEKMLAEAMGEMLLRQIVEE